MSSKSLDSADIVKLVQKAETELPADVIGRLEQALKRERGVGRLQIKNILENIRYAKDNMAPMCQDTGVPIFYVKASRKADYESIKKAIIEGTRKATDTVPLRANIVDPISRRNTLDNTGEGIPIIHVDFHNKDYTEVTVLMKGAGSENMSALGMLNPTGGDEMIVDFVSKTVLDASARPCPPIIVGVGIGGTSDSVMELAKRSLFARLDKKNSNPMLAKLERTLEKRINNLGIGPMGLGGKTTTLGVNILKGSCHTASLPVGVNIQCWANRKSTLRIKGGKRRWSQ